MPDTERTLREATFRGWPAFALAQGPLALHVVPSVGGRLMGMAFEGEELCFIHPALEGRHDDGDAETWATLCADWAFPLWGGGKTWLAPESAWPGGAPHRDLDSGAWTVQAHWLDEHSMGIELQSPVCGASGLQLRRRLSLPRHGALWRIEHSAVNRGTTAWTGGLWDVLMLKRPARVSALRTGAAAVHALPGLPTVDALIHGGLLREQPDRFEIACDQPGAFKLGVDSPTGEVRADLPLARGSVRYLRRAMQPPGAQHAHGHPLEVYNAPVLPYFEIESHSPAVTLQPGERTAFVVEESVQRLVQPTKETHT